MQNEPDSTSSQVLLENRQRFLAFLRSRVGTAEIAEELLHAAYLKGLQQLDTVREDERIVAWFYRLLRNLLYDYYRRRGAETRALDRFAQELALEEGQEDEELERTVCQCVGRVLETLKPEYADVLKRVELEDQSLKQVADEGGVTPNNVAVRLHRARQQLKQSLLTACGTCATHACVDCNCRPV